MNTNHSPGPWVWTRDEDDNGHLILMGDAAHLSNGREVQQVVEYFHGLYPDDPQFEEAEANARLIAAAPSMWALLQRLASVDMLDHEREEWRAIVMQVEGDQS